MKVYKFSVMLVLITLTALLYVHQQVQLIKLSYRIEGNEKEFTSLLDRNKNLVYNVTKFKSPVYLERKFLASGTDYSIPRQCQVVRLSSAKAAGEPAVQLAKAKENVYIAFFKKLGRPAEVFANTIK